MDKQMQDVRVRVFSGDVYIEQSSMECLNNISISVHPDQIDLLIKWLEEARDDLVVSRALDD